MGSLSGVLQPPSKGKWEERWSPAKLWDHLSPHFPEDVLSSDVFNVLARSLRHKDPIARRGVPLSAHLEVWQKTQPFSSLTQHTFQCSRMIRSRMLDDVQSEGKNITCTGLLRTVGHDFVEWNVRQNHVFLTLFLNLQCSFDFKAWSN